MKVFIVSAFIVLLSSSVAFSTDTVLQEFSGSGIQTTRPFTVPDGWEIQWDSTGDLLQIYVYKSDGSLDGIAANQMGSGTGSAYQPKGGSFYLTMNAVGNWKVRVVKVN